MDLHENPDETIQGLVEEDRANLDETDIMLAERKLLGLKKDFGVSHPEYASQALKLGFMKAKIGAPSEALDYFGESQGFLQSALSNVLALSTEESRLKFIKDFNSGYQAALYLITSKFPTDQKALKVAMDLILNHKGIILDFTAKQNQLAASALNSENSELWQHRKELKQKLIGHLLRGNGENTAKIDQTKKDIHAIDVKLNLGNSSSEPQKKVTSRSVAKALDSGVMLIEVVKVPVFNWQTSEPTEESRYLAFTLDHRGNVQYSYISNARKADRAVQASIKVIRKRSKAQESMSALSELHHRIWKPLLEVTEEAGGIVISPEGSLNLVPFAALRNEEGRFLIEDKAVLYVSSGRDLLRKKSRKKPESELALFAYPFYGDPRPDDCSNPIRGAASLITPFCELKGTKKEAEEIPQFFKKNPQVFTGLDATKDRLMSIPAPKVLHIATHGFFLESGSDEVQSPEMRLARSGLAMAGANAATTNDGSFDGILTALEVTGMDLHQTDLVTLSACETGLGDIEDSEGVYGLRRSFVISGANNLMMTLWSVGDTPARIMMKKFYTHYTDDAEPATALRRAQLEYITSLREKNTVAPAYFWAPFIVQGSKGVEAEKESTASKVLKGLGGSIVESLNPFGSLF